MDSTVASFNFVYFLFRSLKLKFQNGPEKLFGKIETKTKIKQVKIGSSLGFTAYLGTKGISLDIKTSLIKEDGKKISK